MRVTNSILIFILFITSCSSANQTPEPSKSTRIENPTNKVLLRSEIVWQMLNPARGAASPQAGTIWGDRKGNEATGFLAKFVDGFSSPPHIHNVTYRAVVIKGLVHNDDPEAANMWMKPGSFWTQPVGESHITSAKGEENLALVEIDQGPYLVKPTDEAFDNGERPINIDVSNVIWLDNQKSNWIEPNCTAELSFLHENNDGSGLRSLFLKLPKGFRGEVVSQGNTFHAVVIQGELAYELPESKEVKSLDYGSYFGATDKAVHSVANTSDGETIVYVRTNDSVYLKASETK